MTSSNFNVIAQAKTSEKKKQVISVGKQKYSKQVGDKKFSLKAKTSGNGKLTYKTSNKKIVTVSKNGYVSIVGEGTAKVTISASETNTYKKASKTVQIIVKPKKISTGISFSGTDETYAVFVYEDGIEIPAGEEINLSKLQNGGVRIYLGNNIAHVDCGYRCTGNERTLEDIDPDFEFSLYVLVKDRMDKELYDRYIQYPGTYDKSSFLPLDDYTYTCITEDDYYDYLVMFVRGYDKDDNIIFENYFNWPKSK